MDLSAPISVPILAATTRGLVSRAGSTRAALAWLAERERGEVVVDVTAADVRPRLLDRGGRRELSAAVKRQGQRVVGLDLLIPAEHFESTATADRAVGAVADAIALAADVRGLGAAHDEPIVCVTMGSEPIDGAIAAIGAAAERDGVRAALLGGPECELLEAVELGPMARSGVDAASRVAQIGARLGVVRVDRFDRRTLTQVGACVGAMSVASPAAFGVADLTDSADAGRALEACADVWAGPMGG
ncbi:MAG: hypothetical protein AAFR96_10895 [Planctomycetota bacterium]